MYENKKILILGGAKSGISVARLLAFKNNDITLADLKDIDDNIKNELKELGIKIVIGGNQLDLLNENYDLVVKNPAIMYTSDIVKKIKEKNILCENEMEVAYHFLPKDIKIIGVTGSNGKTTTTMMIYNLLTKIGQRVILGGNIGTPLAELVPNIKSGDVLLLEISDHQLCDFKDFKTDISVLTNICPTHLDYHGSYEHYMLTKKNIFNRHNLDDIAIINNKNMDSLKITNDILSNKVYFNDDINYYDSKAIYINKEKIIDLDDILLKGSHNYENILCALLVMNNFDLNIDIVKQVFKTFGGVEHRLEYVAMIDGVKYYNDSKSTNPTATNTALKSFEEKIHLILGGMERKQDFNELNMDIKNVKCIYAIGEVTDRVVAYAHEQNIECFGCYKLAEAMEKIKGNVQKGEVVLLSPASSSQDQYVRFEDRGDEFKKIVAKF